MSNNSKVRRLARARMSQTGEKYTQALRGVRGHVDPGRSDQARDESLPAMPAETEFNPFDPGANDPVDLEWPEGLVRPASPPRLVYLDLNHWIGLAQASTGKRDGERYVDVLAAARGRARRGKGQVPPLGHALHGSGQDHEPSPSG